MNYLLKSLLIICVLNSFVLAKVPFVQLFSVGVKIFPSSSDFRLYAETSFWSYIGADAGIEVGTKSVELYSEAQVGIGFLGYSHGLYYRFPYGRRNNVYGWRGKVWAGGIYFASIDFDYTRHKRGFGAFVSLPPALALYKDKSIEDICRELELYCGN